MKISAKLKKFFTLLIGFCILTLLMSCVALYTNYINAPQDRVSALKLAKSLESKAEPATINASPERVYTFAKHVLKNQGEVSTMRFQRRRKYFISGSELLYPFSYEREGGVMGVERDSRYRFLRFAIIYIYPHNENSSKTNIRIFIRKGTKEVFGKNANVLIKEMREMASKGLGMASLENAKEPFNQEVKVEKSPLEEKEEVQDEIPEEKEEVQDEIPEEKEEVQDETPEEKEEVQDEIPETDTPPEIISSPVNPDNEEEE